jgi:hypothetical protein
MLKTARLFILMWGCFFALVASATAQEQIKLSYEQKILQTDAKMASGIVSIYLTNNGDTDLVDVEAWVDGPNAVLYDNEIIYVGDIAAGMARGAMYEWMVPVEMTTVAPSNLPVFWKIEYTDPTGARVRIGGIDGEFLP